MDGLGAAGLLVRLLCTAASAGVVLDDRVQLSCRRLLAEQLGRVPIVWFARRRTGEVVGERVRAVRPFIAHTPGRAGLRVHRAAGGDGPADDDRRPVSGSRSSARPVRRRARCCS
ncbi:hypothetical protein [Amycolatopsis thermoflava]|uniref:hypothetical protein n=1 Tax=Amycolatopsis thermoflava TaxID=84480 RepID=UPI0004202557|nr:hypothetical protein [Amycolatopsis thermoflava]